MYIVIGPVGLTSRGLMLKVFHFKANDIVIQTIGPAIIPPKLNYRIRSPKTVYDRNQVDII